MYKIWVLGGLGNQLFQYVLYLHLSKFGKDVCLDISDYKYYQKHHGFELERIYDLDIRTCSKTNHSNNLVFKITDRINRIFLYFRLPQIKSKYFTYYEFKDFDYREFLKNNNSLYLKGYWQNSYYLNEYRNELIQLLKIKEKYLNDSKLNHYCKLLQDSSSVLIHIRGGDYKELNWSLSKKYYSNAFKYIYDKIYSPVFYVITDDRDYASSILNDFKYELIDDFNGEMYFLNLYLISRARNIISSNSTFCWWGAFLNSTYDYILFPKKWISNASEIKIHFHGDWIKIND